MNKTLARIAVALFSLGALYGATQLMEFLARYAVRLFDSTSSVEHVVALLLVLLAGALPSMTGFVSYAAWLSTFDDAVPEYEDYE
jgi:hypothetical protein